MPTQSAMTLVDAIADDARAVHLAAIDHGLGTQLALVRALTDELARRHPSEERMAALQAQLGEELSRLAGLVPGAGLGVRRSAGEPIEGPIDVLLVDDDVSALHATSVTAKALGYPCRTANSAEEALTAYAHQPAAIVVSDWNMPGGMSGLDLCGRLKARDPHVCVILFTAFHDAGRLREVAGRGIDGFLPKPLDLDAFEARLRAAEGLIRAMRSLERLRGRLKGGSSVPLA